MLIVGGTLATVSAILAMAVAWTPKNECVAQFPKIVGCALGSFENLSGGLIAAGGALFAGWLAWSASRDQIALAARQAKEGDLVQARGRLAQAEFELKRIETAAKTLTAIQTRLHASSTSPTPSANALLKMTKGQEFPSTSRDINTETFGGQAWEVANRLRMIGHQIENDVNSGRYAPPLALSMNENNAAAATAAFDSLTAKMLAAIDAQKAVVAERRSDAQSAEKIARG